MNHPSCSSLLRCVVLVPVFIALPTHSAIVINEIHYNPDVKTEPVEFIELYNDGTNAVNLGGWSFSAGVQYVFPANTVVPAGGYVVVAENPQAVSNKFGGVRAIGPYTGGLTKYGEQITLRDASGDVQDEVDYQSGFPWPTVGDPPGYSIELINPKLDNDLGGSWRASSGTGGAPPQNTVLISDHSAWRYFKGTNEASSPTTVWRQLSFDDTAWLNGNAPIGYGETFLTTVLSDMQNGYTSVFLRRKFVVSDLAQIASLVLEGQYDDGIKVWINGVNVVNANIATTEVPFNGTAIAALESAAFVPFPISAPAGVLVQGTNIIAVQLHNVSLGGSSDCYLDLRLTASSGPSGSGPTPGARNVVYATNAPPQIRQVQHQPESPAAGQPVRITAKVTDPDGVAGVTLEYQTVNPGSYIELTDAAYTNSWTSVAMHDDGTASDAVANDSIFTVELPGALQVHRRLIRYRITVSDTLGRSVRVPYADDPQPNFAYFCYNGVPGWNASVRPGVSPALDFSSNVMGRLPVIHLIGKSNTVATATWFSRYGGDQYLWAGTLVYDGQVYDHVHFRARGGVWRYSMVKNMWKFDLNRGHDFQMRDNWGRRFNTGWTKLNLGACIQQGDYNHRGEQGMFESVGFRLFELAGVDAPKSAFVTFRVIDDAAETPGDQYEGDFWGLYLALEQEDGRFLEEHGLPDGNFYKMEGGTGELNNTAPTGPTDKSDLNAFLNTYNSGTNASLPETWWRANLHLPKYYSYQAVVQAIHHYDIADGKNYFYLLNPDTRQWQVSPWDLDLTWADNMYRSGQQGGDEPFKSRVLSNFAYPGARPVISREFRNRIREFRDLLWNTDQVYKLIDEYAALVRGPTNGPTILDADRAKWDYNPKMNDGAYTPNLGKAGQGRFYQWPNEPTVTKDFNGCIQLMRNYVLYRASNSTFSLDTMASEPQRPNKPVITYTGPAGHPINRLAFQCSNFSSPDPAATFAALRWRVAEVSYPGVTGFDPTGPWAYEITANWQTTGTVFVATITLPPESVRANRTFRARALFTDNQGRNSNWSDPIEFAVGEPDGASDLLNFLRITELMYHPLPGGFEYVELRNISPSVTLDLAGVRFSDGIDYTFPAGTLLPPGGYLLVVGTADFAAFRAYYGLDRSVTIVGPYLGALNNAGEQITLRTAAGGTDIVAFNYGDGRGWPPTADGAGHSLVLLDAAEQAQGSGAGNFSGNWQASAYLRGSPGRADSPLAPPVLLNEIVAHTDFTNALDSNDWIELYNPQETNFVFGPGWFLSDDSALLTKWQIPPTNIVPARGWLTFDEVTGFHNPTNIGFGLSKAGEEVFLSYLPGTAQDRVVDAVTFKGQENDWSLGRFPDGGPYWFALNPRTRDAANAPPPLQVVLNELHFHPPDSDGTNDNTLDEFIELLNPTSTAVPLFNTNGAWRLSGGVDFLFPNNLVLGPGELLVVVNFNPTTNLVQLAAFRSIFGITNPALPILGPYGGKLNNSSDRVALERPQAPDLPGDPVAWVVVDEVIYSDQSPWPCASDGTGNSLQRVDPAAHGCAPANWTAQVPSPGRPREPIPAGAPSIVGQPQSRAVPTNGNASFSVALCGTPPFTYQWRFNNTNLPGATNATLQLVNVTLADAGDYAVEVGNAAGSILSATATLWVQVPPLIARQPESTNVVRDLPAWFSVEAAGTPPFSYQWRFNTTNLPGETNMVLHLPAVQVSQAGAYSVLVLNSAGSALSGDALLTVRIPATVTNQPQDQYVTNGATVVFAVGATGTGLLAYQWMFNGVPLTGATLSSLTLTNVQLADMGDYTVRVTDDIGSTLSRAARLIVKIKPVFVRNPETQTIFEGQNVTFSVEVSGTPPFGYYWRRNSTIYVPFDQAGPVLTLTNVPVSQNGAYFECVVTNIAIMSPGVLSRRGYLYVYADHDHDGMADVWEAAHGLNTNSVADASIDSDGDGLTNLQEYQAGTDPTDPASYLKIDRIFSETSGGLTVWLQFLAAADRTYSVIASEGATETNWTRVVDVPSTATNRVVEVPDPRPPGSLQRYYRLVTPRLP